nr:transporter [Desulfosarcina cetonica]
MGSHYPFGGEGVLAGSGPPPGFHYRGYAFFTNPTHLKDDNGDDLDVGFDAKVLATVHRFLHVTQKKILGAYYAYEVVVPIVDKEVNIDVLGVSDSKSLSLGDVFFEPFTLIWHRPRWDATLTLGVYAPTGEYDSDNYASPGLGYWSGMLTLGGTVYFDDHRSWSLSAMTRTLVNTEQDETDVTPGPELVVEYGLGKEIGINEKLSIRPGICGSAYWQIGDDSDDGPGTLADERKQAYSLGAEINFFWLPPKLLQLNLRALREFGAKNTTQGSQVVLTLTKSW